MVKTVVGITRESSRSWLAKYKRLKDARKINASFMNTLFQGYRLHSTPVQAPYAASRSRQLAYARASASFTRSRHLSLLNLKIIIVFEFLFGNGKIF